jgi:hypothetical protein
MASTWDKTGGIRQIRCTPLNAYKEVKKDRIIRRPFCQRNYGPINEFVERLIKTIVEFAQDESLAALRGFVEARRVGVPGI